MKMMKMAALVAVAATMMFGTTPSFASAGREADKASVKRPALEQGAKCRQEALTAAGVSDAQKADLKAMHQKYRPQMQEIRKSTLSQEEKAAKVKELAKAMRAERAKILTPEQMEKMKQYIKENCPRGMGAEKKPKGRTTTK